MPMSDSAGAESLGVSMAVETALPDSLGISVTGSGLVALDVRPSDVVLHGLVLVALGHLRRLHAEVGVLGRGVPGCELGVRDGLGGDARGTGNGVLPVAGHGTVTGRGRRPRVLLLPTQEHGHACGDAGEEEQPRPAPPLLLDPAPALDLLRGGGGLLLEVVPLLHGVLARLLRR